jgi:hypothetical protein
VTARKVSDQELSELRALMRDDGTLNPVDVVDAARKKSSALHDRFTWDDAEAGKLRRLDESHELIRVVRVQFSIAEGKPPIDVRAFVSLGSDRLNEGGGYRQIETVMSDAQLRSELLRTALMELQSLQKRYGHLSKLAQVFAAAENVGKRQTRRASRRNRKAA